jgi:hypothetical protein
MAKILEATMFAMRRAAVDTISALAKTDATIIAMNTQADIMRGQLTETGKQIAIVEVQLRPRMALSFETSNSDLRDTQTFKIIHGRFVTPTSKNSGSLEPEGLVGWSRMATFAEYLAGINPDTLHLGQDNSALLPLPSPSPNIYVDHSEFINERNILLTRARTHQLIGWGYVEYRDPFPQAPTQKMVLQDDHSPKA